ncbi:MAG: Uma2 family endonuclease, partial [Cyanobacteria bacterium P01_C01_bin.120]
LPDAGQSLRRTNGSTPHLSAEALSPVELHPSSTGNRIMHCMNLFFYSPLMPGHEVSDRAQKYEYYQAAGVPEYWLVEPTAEQVEFYRLIDGHYQQQPLAADGFYRPSSVPGLAFCPAVLWQDEDASPIDAGLWVVEQPVENWQRPPSEVGPKWGSLLFISNIQLEAVSISFEEFISWAPRAKFEFIEGKPLIESTPGTRNVLAMLLMTFGLASVVQLLPPQA